MQTVVAPVPSRASRRRPVFGLVFRLGVLTVLIGLVVRFADLHRVGQALENVSALTFAACVGLELAIYAVESWRVRMLSAGAYSYRAIWRSRLLSALLSNLLPGMSAGEVVRVFLLDAYRPGNKLTVALLLLSNRLYGLLTSAALLLLGLLLSSTNMTAASHTRLIGFGAASAVTLIAPLLLFRLRLVRGALTRLIRRAHGRLRRTAAAAYLAMARFGQPRRALLAVLSSALSNGFVVATLVLLSRSVGMELPLPLAIIFVVVGGVSRFLPLGIGGIGPQDATIVLLGRLAGEPVEACLALSLVMHMTGIAGTFVGFAYVRDARPILHTFLGLGAGLGRFLARISGGR